MLIWVKLCYGDSACLYWDVSELTSQRARIGVHMKSNIWTLNLNHSDAEAYAEACSHHCRISMLVHRDKCSLMELGDGMKVPLQTQLNTQIVDWYATNIATYCTWHVVPSLKPLADIMIVGTRIRSYTIIEAFASDPRSLELNMDLDLTLGTCHGISPFFRVKAATPHASSSPVPSSKHTSQWTISSL